MNLDPSSSALAFFAAELKRIRTAAGMTQETLANAINYAASTVAAVETCRLIPSSDFAERVDKVLGADGLLVRLQRLVEETCVLPWFRDLVSVEKEAIEIRVYANYVIPGLLQTEDYARCCVSAARPVLTADEVNDAVALRMTRQEILNRDDPPRLWAIIDESVLRRVNGGNEVMAAQLRHLIKMNDRPNIVVQVIPDSEGSTSAGGRGFMLLTFRSKPTIAYLEDIFGARHVRKPDEVSMYGLIFDHPAVKRTVGREVRSVDKRGSPQLWRIGFAGERPAIHRIKVNVSKWPRCPTAAVPYVTARTLGGRCCGSRPASGRGS